MHLHFSMKLQGAIQTTSLLTEKSLSAQNVSFQLSVINFSFREQVFNSTSLFQRQYSTVLFFHLVSRGKKIAHKIYRFSKHVVIFLDYSQVCISQKKKGVVDDIFVSQRLGWIIAEIFHRKVIHRYLVDIRSY